MKVSLYAQASYNKDKGIIGFKVLPECLKVAEKFFDYKRKRETVDQVTLNPKITIDLPANDRTLKQNRTLWSLITIIYKSQNGEDPDDDEKYNLYLDILDVYADKIENKLKPGSYRPVHISESDTVQAAKLIDACICILSEYCDLDYNLQADVKDVFDEWMAYLGSLEDDPLDYSDYKKKILLTESEWRERNKRSAATGRLGTLLDPINKAHLVSEGASGIDDPRDWVPLLASEHSKQHNVGWTAYIKMYPSLKGRYNRANRLFGKKER